MEFFNSAMSLDDEDDKELYNPCKAIKFYKLSAKLGYAPAMDKYANLITDEDVDVEHDVDKALKLLLSATKLGYIPAYASLAQLYEDGVGVERDINKAIEFYKISADANDPLSQYQLGYIYDYVLGKSKEAEYWYSKAIAGCTCYAADALGRMYYYGRGEGTIMPDSTIFPIDYYRAFSCFTLAYKLGSESALTYIANCYFEGHGVNENKDVAIKMYIEASENDFFASEALGQIFMTGNGINQNVKKAIEYWKKGAEQGSSECMRELGDFYKWGESGDEDEKVFEEYIDKDQALYWYQCGAELGDEYCLDEVNSHNNGEW